jgi:hypothetical protein
VATIKEKADAEAARAEAENPDEPAAEPGTEPVETEPDEEEAAEEETPAPEPAEPAENPDALRKGVDRAVRAFHNKLCALFDADGLVPVPVEGALGFMLPGFIEPKAHPNFTRCTTCNGFGKVLTGSLDPQHERATCPDERCKGRGFWQKSGTPQPATGPLAVAPPPAEPENGEWAPAPAWMGDPNLAPGA